MKAERNFSSRTEMYSYGFSIHGVGGRLHPQGKIDLNLFCAHTRRGYLRACTYTQMGL